MTTDPTPAETGALAEAAHWLTQTATPVAAGGIVRCPWPVCGWAAQDGDAPRLVLAAHLAVEHPERRS